MKKVVLYARSASSHQSLADQVQLMNSRLGAEVTVVATFQDLAPASDAGRSGLQQTLDYLARNQVDTLMVSSIDRLVRSTSQLSGLRSWLQSQGVRLEVVPAN